MAEKNDSSVLTYVVIGVVGYLGLRFLIGSPGEGTGELPKQGNNPFDLLKNVIGSVPGGKYAVAAQKTIASALKPLNKGKSADGYIARIKGYGKLTHREVDGKNVRVWSREHK